jgi:uncharacterized membrane protein
MQVATTHITLATSSGAVWLALAVHVGTALMGLAAGAVALVAAKGGKAHKLSGIIFTYAMIITGLFAAGISVYEGKSAGGGLFTAYLIFTATTTVKPLPGDSRGVNFAMMLLAFALAAVGYWGGVVAWNSPGHVLGGVPSGMIVFMATVTLLAATGDLRMIRAGGITGSRRLARHLWRMCFGLFIATGSFFIGQMKFVPQPIRIVPLLMLLGVAPLFVLLYWMWRVRLRKRLGGLIIRSPVAVNEAA